MRITRLIPLACCIAACLSVGALRATAATFVLDPNNSNLKVSVGGYEDDGNGNLVFVSFTSPQTPGSDNTSLSGSLQATVGGGLIDFTGLSNIVFDNQSVDQEPLPGGILPGSATANYGVNLNVFDGAIFGPGAIRGALADLTGNSLLVGNQFDSAGLLLALTAGTIDINLDANAIGQGILATSAAISGNSAANLATPGTLDLVGSDLNLYIPIFVEVAVPVQAGSLTLTVIARFEGQITATSLVPEPSTFLMAGVGLVGLGAAGYRRARSKS